MIVVEYALLLLLVENAHALLSEKNVLVDAENSDVFMIKDSVNFLKQVVGITSLIINVASVSVVFVISFTLV
jgi:hypothetical protein